MYQKRPSITQPKDRILILLYVAIALIGLLCIFSVEYRGNEDVVKSYFALQKELQQTICLSAGLFRHCYIHFTNGQQVFYGYAKPVVHLWYITDDCHFCSWENGKWLQKLDSIGVHEPSARRNLQDFHCSRTCQIPFQVGNSIFKT